ncbi:maleylpyruvate isomerase family mycothiol-dependent enzyme [Nocardioides sp. J54]|uniref:maleylpyruvate isomerase family mycothiol-dependent enzyme n=1 Tax=Nocardioides sp. J54 TaxID=935866 RepID=UPI000491EFD4|nr:maleylpyruvate isomerase family mycothiol-dependent enzyme [Nocardioides sp. J54]
MTRLDDATYLEHIRRESARFAQVLAACPPDARVPSCPEWDATDLWWHLAGVQDFWHHVVSTRPTVPEDYEDPQRPEERDAVRAFFDDAHRRFVTALAAADPADHAWSWSSRDADQCVGFTFRRQAHEALIHRLDAELAAGTPTPLPTELAADGVHEALDTMYGELPAWGRFDPEPLFVEYRITDVDRSVWGQLGTFTGTEPDGTEHVAIPDQHVVDDPGRPADLVVSGTADRLDGWLWHRYDDTGITVEGDPHARERAFAVLEQPID